MDYQSKSGALENQRGNCLVVGVYEKRKPTDAAKTVDQATDGLVRKVMRAGGMDGKTGQTRLVYEPEGLGASQLLLVGLGEKKKRSPESFRKAVDAAVRTMNDAGIRDATFALAWEYPADEDLTYWGHRQVVETAEASAYRFEETLSKKPDAQPLKRITCWHGERGEKNAVDKALRHGRAIASGQQYARELGNLPANVCTPSYLGDEAKKLARKHGKKFTTKVLSEADAKRLKMGSFLSVAKGSDEPAKFIVMEYKGTQRKRKPQVLVGKGLTFDTGGISLKPAPTMDEMKFDMCGGASVFGTLHAAAEMGLPIHLVGLVPATENHINGSANKPGDVVTSMSGQTVEILNTDAEGRLILNDALTYAKRYEPAAVIDIATLTGACVVALGSHASGLMSKHDDLAEQLLEAGQKSRDRAWRLPLWDDYQKQLNSSFADMANIGGKEAGTITAGCFLSRYTEGMRWAHVDVAGTAWVSGSYPNKGATGRPVPMLSQYLIDQS